MTVRTRIFGVAAACVAFGPRAAACPHVPVGYKGVIQERTKQAFAFHDGTSAHLIIKTEFQAEGALPPTMAWIIPLPSLPTRYKEADKNLFADLHVLTEPPSPVYKSGEPMPMAGSAPAEGGIIVHAARTVGNYKVQPIEIASEESGGEELNRWLASNGFNTVAATDQRHYLKRGAVFLALRLRGLAGRVSDVRPLHITYRASTLSVPLKFSSGSGVFDLHFYTWTSQKPDAKLLGNFGKVSRSMQLKPTTLDTQTASLARLVGFKSGFLTRFEGRDFNAPGKPVALLAEDPTLSPEGTMLSRPSRLLQWWERREVLGLLAAGLACAVLALVKRRVRN